VAAKYAEQFAPVNLITIDKEFGGWRNAQKTHSLMTAGCSTRFPHRTPSKGSTPICENPLF
jgi:ABC-type sulfate transport system substrate-binding protein